MEIKLTEQEAQDYFYNSLCNGLGYVGGYGLELDYVREEYQAAKKRLQEKNEGNAICLEDVLMQILRDGNRITLIDVECDGEYTRSITLSDVNEWVQKAPTHSLVEMAEERDDADTADAILQTVFFKEIIFG